MLNFTTVARLLVVCAIACAVVAGMMAKVGIRVIPFELPCPGENTAAAIEANRAKLEESLGYDRWFVLAYLLLFLGYAWLHALRGGTYAAVATGLLAILTAVLDVAENAAVLAVPLVPTKLYAASSMKWLLFFLLLLSCAPLFLGTGHRALTLIAALFALVGGAGVCAAASLAFTCAYRERVGALMLVAFLPLLAATVVFARWPHLLQRS